MEKCQKEKADWIFGRASELLQERRSIHTKKYGCTQFGDVADYLSLMARTTAKERLARREHALALLADGNSFRTVAALVSGKYGVSERTAQRDLSWAKNDW